MAVGELKVTPVTVRNLNKYQDAVLSVRCGDDQSTQFKRGPEFYWNETLTCHISMGMSTLGLELVNQNSNYPNNLGSGKIELAQVFKHGRGTEWVQFTSYNEPVCEVQVEISFSGTDSVSSVSSSFGNMSMADGQQVSYQQTTSHSQYTSHSQPESRQGSFASLGPANPIPSNYGSGSPPPFTPPPAVSYPEKSGNNSMPGSNMPGSNMPGMPPAGGLLSGEQQQRPPIDNMTRSEFEVAKEKGAIPSWMKYGGGALASAAAIGLTAWGAHELKEHFDDKKEEEERLKKQQEHGQSKPFVPPAGYLQQQGQQPQHAQPPQQHNQQGQYNQQGDQHRQQYPQPPQQHPIQAPQYHEKNEHKSEHKKEKKDKKDKKDKKYKKHGSDSNSSSDSDSSDSSDDERKEKKDKHHKKKDSDWK